MAEGHWRYYLPDLIGRLMNDPRKHVHLRATQRISAATSPWPESNGPTAGTACTWNTTVSGLGKLHRVRSTLHLHLIQMQHATRANNAIGAIALSIFGAVWLAAWCLNTPLIGKWPLLIIAAVAGTVIALAVRMYRRNSAAYVVYRKSAEGMGSSIVLGLVNALQWALITLLAALLPESRAHWFVPGVILIVGVHFIPLAYALRYRPYLLTAATLLGLAASASSLATFSPASPLAALGTGAILWLTAIYQLAANPATRGESAVGS